MRIDKDGVMAVTVEFKLWDKPGTLRLVCRHIGLFADRVEHTGPNGGPIGRSHVLARCRWPTKGDTMTIWALLLLIVGLGLLAMLIDKAPFIPQDYKPIIRWILLAVIVLIIAQITGVITYLKTTVIGR